MFCKLVDIADGSERAFAVFVFSNDHWALFLLFLFDLLICRYFFLFHLILLMCLDRFDRASSELGELGPIAANATCGADGVIQRSRPNRYCSLNMNHCRCSCSSGRSYAPHFLFGVMMEAARLPVTVHRNEMPFIGHELRRLFTAGLDHPCPFSVNHSRDNPRDVLAYRST